MYMLEWQRDWGTRLANQILDLNMCIHVHAYLVNSSLIRSLDIPYFIATSSFSWSSFSPSLEHVRAEGSQSNLSLKDCSTDSEKEKKAKINTGSIYMYM